MGISGVVGHAPRPSTGLTDDTHMTLKVTVSNSVDHHRPNLLFTVWAVLIGTLERDGVESWVLVVERAASALAGSLLFGGSAHSRGWSARTCCVGRPRWSRPSASAEISAASPRTAPTSVANYPSLTELDASTGASVQTIGWAASRGRLFGRHPRLGGEPRLPLGDRARSLDRSGGPDHRRIPQSQRRLLRRHPRLGDRRKRQHGDQLDASTGAVVQTIGVGNQPSAVSSDGTHVWVGNLGDGTLTQLAIANGSLQITTTSLPAATVGQPYSFQLQATGGTPPYTWNKYLPKGRGALPPRLSISKGGLISGTPKKAGTWTIIVKCLQATAHPNKTLATQELTLTINP